MNQYTESQKQLRTMIAYLAGAEEPETDIVDGYYYTFLAIFEEMENNTVKQFLQWVSNEPDFGIEKDEHEEILSDWNFYKNAIK